MTNYRVSKKTPLYQLAIRLQVIGLCLAWRSGRLVVIRAV